MINQKHINELSRIKSNRQQRLESQLGELNQADKELRDNINNVDKQLRDNRDERSSNVKGFYSTVNSGKTFNAKSIYALELALQKLDSKYNTIEEQKTALIEQLEALQEQIKTVQKGIKELIIKQEKYKYLVENLVQ
jgi:chromosome segregation ATPase